jgi:polar amino acid transport system permease protein
MTAISLISISFFVFWLWLLMDFVNQQGVEKGRKERLIMFHTFLGLIGIAFYFFLMISAFASSAIVYFDKVSTGTYWAVTRELRPALVAGFIIILLFPIVAATNLLLKKKYEAKKYLRVINIIEGLAIVVVFIYILAVGSTLSAINETGPYPYLISDIVRGKALYFGIDFEIYTLSFTFSVVFHLLIATILIWLLAVFHYLFIIKIPLKRREIVMLNTEEIKKISEMENIYRNALYFLVGFGVILLRNVWDWISGWRIKQLFIHLSTLISGFDVTKLRSIIDNELIVRGFRAKFGLGFYKFFDSFFAGNVQGIISPAFVIGCILLFFAIIVFILLLRIKRELENIQESHEVKMNALKHSVYMNTFNAWRVSLFAAITTIMILIYFYSGPPGRYAAVFNFVIPGVVVTFEVTIASMLIALLLGMLAGLGKLSNNALIKGIASVYVEVVRGIPLLVQIFYIHFGLGRLLNLPPLVSAITAMSWCYGAYLGETFRAGIQSISKGQTEAAKSLGMTNFQMMREVILPQAVKVILPPVGNDFIALLKDSSLVSVIAVPDILRRGREFTAVYFNALHSYTMVALIYLVITLILSKVVWNMEKIMATD